MQNTAGENARDMKHANRLRVLRLLATEGPLSRAEIARCTGLTKMTTSNITADLLEAGLIDAFQPKPQPTTGAGRRPEQLAISGQSPCVLGIFIGRRHCSVQICDLRAQVQAEQTRYYGDTLDGEGLVEIVMALYAQVREDCDRKLLGAGISALGPLNGSTGVLLSPPNFYGIHDFPLRSRLEQVLNLPCTLMHDSSAGALAERLYGAGRNLDDFLYLHIQDGIGAGIIVNGELFDGAVGLGGELGHISINFDGPACPCGNRGCLELYANDRMLVAELKRLGHETPGREPTFQEVVDLAGAGNPAAVGALDRFCDYLSYGLVSCLNIIDTHRIFVGYQGGESSLLEQLLEEKVNLRLLAGASRRVRVERSLFRNRAPVIGAAALVARQVFSGQLSVLPTGP